MILNESLSIKTKTVLPKPLESLLTDYLTDFMTGVVTLSANKHCKNFTNFEYHVKIIKTTILG